MYSIEEIYIFPSCVGLTYFVDEEIKKSFENVRKRFNKTRKTSKSSKFVEPYRWKPEKQLRILKAINLEHGWPLSLKLAKPKQC